MIVTMKQALDNACAEIKRLEGQIVYLEEAAKAEYEKGYEDGYVDGLYEGENGDEY